MSRSSMRRFLLMPFAVLLFFPLPVAALEDEVEDLLSRADYSGSVEARVESVFERADSDDVPAELLVPRLAEGVAKGVPGSRVAEVLDGRLDVLLSARRIFRDNGVAVAGGQSGSRGLWSAAALLLWDDSPEEHLARLARESNGRRPALRESFSLYASLIDWGLSRPQAVELGVAALSSDLDVDDYPGIVRILTEARRQRIPIPQAIERLTDEIPQSGSLSGLRERVIYSD